MSGTHARLLLAMVVAAVVAAMGISSAADARHWRYHGYRRGFSRGRRRIGAKTPRSHLWQLSIPHRGGRLSQSIRG